MKVPSEETKHHILLLHLSPYALCYHFLFLSLTSLSLWRLETPAKMGEETVAAVPVDRAVEQAIVAIKKGAYLLKCRRRGKPKCSPFRLSTDEKYLIWYSGKEEKKLRLSSVTNIVSGQRTENFERQIQPQKESQSFSLIYDNSQRSLDLICKDKVQADLWLLGLGALISRCDHPRSSDVMWIRRGVQSCVNSPAGYFRRKHNLGLLGEDPNKFSQVRSLCGSPTHSLSKRCLFEGLSYSLETHYSSESSPSIPYGPYTEPDKHKKREPIGETEMTNVLRDVMIWGKGVKDGGYLRGDIDNCANFKGVESDALSPILLDSTSMLDVHKISLGSKHAALVTKQGEVYSWGEGNGGKLGHQSNVDVSQPKIVGFLTGIQVKSVACSEYQTCALTISGELYTWGESLLGDEKIRSNWVPHRLLGPTNGIVVSHIACGEWHTAITSTSGQLFTYGDGTFGVLGHGNTRSISQPKEVEALRGLKVKSAACGPWHTAAIVDVMFDRFKSNGLEGKLFTWGDGDKGRLGHYDQGRKLLPTCVARLVDHDFVQVCCGRMFTVGLTNLGKVYSMGKAVRLQFGNFTNQDKSIALVEGKLKDEFVKEISSGSNHVVCLTSTGNVYSWGNGENGRLGLGDVRDRDSPTLVEALRGRQVESIACGPSSTAAICLHKSISSSDQLTCNGCMMGFGFKRKKHNCYNCGLLFCQGCSSKKVIDAPLAPNKRKPFRVCDQCFDHMQRITHEDKLLKLKIRSPRNLLRTRKEFNGEKKQDRNLPNEEHQYREMKALKNQENQQPLGSVASFSSMGPRWGQVARPMQFRSDHREDLEELISFSKYQFPFSTMNVEGGLPEEEMLIEEVQRLKAEAISLEKECETRSGKIQECQLKVEETWTLARNEAAKCKAAKEVIKALTARLFTMSEKFSSGQEQKDEVDSPTLGVVTPTFGAMHLPCETKVVNHREPDSLCHTPILPSDASRSMYGRNVCDVHTRSMVDSRQNGVKDMKLEWVEQYEDGVYITLSALPCGQKGLKRVRFSRKRFTKREAERWWEDNQQRVYEAYTLTDT